MADEVNKKEIEAADEAYVEETIEKAEEAVETLKEEKSEDVKKEEEKQEDSTDVTGKELTAAFGKYISKNSGKVFSGIKSFFKKIGNGIHRFFKFGIIPAIANAQWSQIPVSTYVRWILAIVLSINTILMKFNLSPIQVNEGRLAEIVAIVLNVGVLLINTYKNNSTSKEALVADEIMHALKAAGASESEDALGKIHDILADMNGENYVQSDYVEKESSEKSDEESV